MIPETLEPLLWVILGGTGALIGAGLGLLTWMPHPRRFGFTVDSEARQLHDRLAGCHDE